MVPRDIKILIPGTSECYFTWKRDFTDAIIARILRWEDDPRLLSWALNAINKKDPYKKDTERNLTTKKRKLSLLKSERTGIITIYINEKIYENSVNICAPTN